MDPLNLEGRLGSRAWRRVRSPELPAWAWLAIDVFVGGLVATVVTTIVGFWSTGIAEHARTFLFFVIVAVAIANFIRSRSPDVGDP